MISSGVAGGMLELTDLFFSAVISDYKSAVNSRRKPQAWEHQACPLWTPAFFLPTISYSPFLSSFLQPFRVRRKPFPLQCQPRLPHLHLIHSFVYFTQPLSSVSFLYLGCKIYSFPYSCHCSSFFKPTALCPSFSSQSPRRCFQFFFTSPLQAGFLPFTSNMLSFRWPPHQ